MEDNKVTEKTEDDNQEEQDIINNDELPLDESGDEPDNESEEDKDKKTARNTVIAALILIGAFVLVFNYNSVTGFFAKEELPIPDDYFYQGKFHFVKDGSMWKTQLIFGNKVINIPLHFGPRDVDDVIIEGEVDDRFINSSRLYLTFDPGEQLGYVALAASELSLNLVQAMNIGLTAACTTNSSESCYLRPIITCDNTDKGVIYIKEDFDQKITMEGNCITIQGTGDDLIKAVDRLLLKWYRVMD